MPTTDLQATLDRIDAVTADACGWCGTTLDPDGPSPDFCCQPHQARWQAHTVATAPDPELLLGEYRPWVLSTTPDPVTAARVAAARVAALPASHARLDRVWVDEVAPFLREVAVALAPVFAEACRRAGDAIRALGLAHDSTPPTDVRARALWLRQHRNTGPARRTRPPRSITPGRSR